MGKLAEIAGAKRGLTGPVTLVDATTGTCNTYDDEAAAEAALPAGANVEHRRGSFFVGGAAAKPTTEEKPKAEEPKAEESSTSSRRGRRRRSSSSDES